MRDQSTPSELSKRVIHYLNYRAASKFALTDEVRNDDLYWKIMVFYWKMMNLCWKWCLGATRTKIFSVSLGPVRILNPEFRISSFNSYYNSWISYSKNGLITALRPEDGNATELLRSASEVCECALQMMNFALQMMNVAFIMMNFALQMMNFCINNDELRKGHRAV